MVRLSLFRVACAMACVIYPALVGCNQKPSASGPQRLYVVEPSSGEQDDVATAVTSLDSGTLPETLRERFAESGVELPNDTPVMVVTPGEEWQINVDTAALSIKQVDGALEALQGAPLQRVLYVTPITEEVTEYEEFTGRTAATETIELRARVSGYLDKIHFEDGADVKQGDLLFKIDDRPFVAEEKRTAAVIDQYEARIRRLRSQERRSKELYEKQALSQDEYETIKFDLQEAEATLEASIAQHDVAKLNLQFTEVRAAISGRIGRRAVDEGNLVTADETALAVLIPLEEVYVYFDMDERTVLKLRRLQNRGMIGSALQDEVSVDIALADSEEFTLSGKIDFLDNQIDPATGTLRVRATVENPDGLLSPGLFTRLRYPIGKPSRSLLIPEESLASDQGRPFVYVINKFNVVEARPVEVGPQVGGNRVIREGLATGERVAVTGLQRLRRKAAVAPEERSLEEPADAAVALQKGSTSAKTAKASVHEAAE